MGWKLVLAHTCSTLTACCCTVAIVATAAPAGAGTNARCLGGLIADDGSAEYGSGATAIVPRVTKVQRFELPVVPFGLDDVCVGWLRMDSEDDTLDYEIVVYDANGPDGSPGGLVAAIPAVATGLPYASLSFIREDISGYLSPASVGVRYVGVRWQPSVDNSFWVCFDASPETTAQLAYTSSNDGVTWVEMGQDSPEFRSFLIRICGGKEAVAPHDLADREGNSNDSVPWLHSEPVAYQQVFAGADLAPGRITELRFRREGGTPPVGLATASNVSVTLSSTSAAPDGLSPTFADNLGGDAIVVFSGNLEMSSNATDDPPQRFDLALPLQQHFTFDPGYGPNLLMEVRVDAGSPIVELDAGDSTGDGVSRAICYGDQTCAAATQLDTAGLVTLVRYETLVFVDDLEDGDTGAWSTTVPAPPL